MGKRTTESRRNVEQDRPLISHSTILILSSFLIGMASRQVVQSGVEAYVYLAGLAGIVAYVALERLARRRRQRTATLARKRASTKLENRVYRHVAHEVKSHTVRPRARRREMTRQYLPVVHSNRRALC